MSRKTDLAVRNLELKCRRSGKRIFSAAALAVALGICTLAAVGIQKYGTAAMKDGVSDKGNGLRAVFAMFTGGAERGSKKNRRERLGCHVTGRHSCRGGKG